MLSEQRFSVLYQGMNAQLRKVFDAAPAGEAWSKVSIGQELARIGRATAPNVVDGCLSRLADDGLLVEGPRGHFRRAPVRSSNRAAAIQSPHKEDPMLKNTEPASPAPAPKNAIDRLAVLATSADQLVKAALALREQIEAAAIEISDAHAADLSAMRTELEQLRQVRALLRQIATE